MKVLIIGAGAVGQVYGRHLALGGAEVSFYVKDKYADYARKGFTFYTLSKKNARKNPKYFKRAELRLRELLRRLDTFRRDMGFDDRHVLDDVLAHMSKKIDALVEATLRGS